jgi:integrase
MSRRGSTPKKNPDTLLWETRIDVAPAGAPRRQEWVRAQTKTEVQRKANELLVNVDRRTHVNRHTVTLREWSEDWLEGLPATGLRESTVNFYADMTGHLVKHLGDARLQLLEPADLNRCYAALLAEGRRPGRGLSLATVRKVHITAGKLLGEAVKQKVLVRNPAADASPPKPSAARAPEMTTWSAGELREFLEFTADDELGVLFRVVGMSGLRRGEVCGLRWSDLEDDRLAVRRQVVLVDGEPRLADLKTDGSRRSIDLDAETVAVLARHRRAQLEERMALGLGRSEMIFTTPAGGLLNPESVARSFERRVKASGQRRIRFHDLRHSHASHLIQSGAHAKLVAERLGHASAAFTLDRYGHLFPSTGADAAAAVAALVDGGGVR